MTEAVVGSSVEKADQARRKMAPVGHEEVEEDNVTEAAASSFQKLAYGVKLLDHAQTVRLVGAGLEKAVVDSTLETPVQEFQKEAFVVVVVHNSELLPRKHIVAAEAAVRISELPLRWDAVAAGVLDNADPQ